MIRYLFLTGAGISAESGIKTFRDNDGLWDNHRIEDVADPKAFVKDPAMVWEFYKQRYFQSLSVQPNPAHYALVKLENHIQENFHLITQNVDGLHTKAGSKRVKEMHGRLEKCFCTVCRSNFHLTEIDLAASVPSCLKCGNKLRPDIVWFTEIPYYLYEIEDLLKKCDVFVIVGTSGIVYPAAGFVMTAKLFGARTIAINLEKPENRNFIDEFYQGKSGELLPPMIEEILEHYER